ncbi:hypothetical protein GPECTOR_9g708 [Gonium pectorale]|uniref:Rieske domain-containing protein n=1 Tax=Gonium pectorale TaxID=33097 RepID=A0A150GS60_GONPE|nr:hypothetical protein GPECTOR_9g708 [Gonium pectorale]|eukprot:KXZ52663.1 hypothetical protein GPECTOR_9g708 [Gonium pectorale]
MAGAPSLREDERARIGRRGAAAVAAAAAVSLLLGPQLPVARAENGPLPRSCDPAAAGSTGPGSSPLLVPYTDPAGRFRLARPCGWSQVTSLLPGSSVLASFYSPEEPGAETLAVYVAPAAEGVRTTEDLGGPQAFAAGLAAIAPNGIVQEAYGMTHGGLSYLVAHVQFGGNTAGMFGSAREFRAVTIREGQQYTLRITTTRYRYLAFPEATLGCSRPGRIAIAAARAALTSVMPTVPAPARVAAPPSAAAGAGAAAATAFGATIAPPETLPRDGAAAATASAAPPPPAATATTAAAPVVGAAATASAVDSDADGGSFPWFSQWYPLAVEAHLDRRRPQGAHLLGVPLALWWDPGAGAWRAVEDQCPHRLAPLSEGRVEADGSLQCAYHGWCFSGGAGGACTHIPQLRGDERAAAAATASRRSRVRSFPVQVRHGLLWVRPDSSDASWAEAATNPTPSNALAELAGGGPEGDGRWAQYATWFVRDLPIRYDTLLENLLDPSHVPFSHHGIMGTRSTERGTTMRLLRSDGAGFEGRFNMSGAPSDVRFTAPALTWYKTGGFLTIIYAVPTRPGWSRAIHGYVRDTSVPARVPRLAFALRSALAHVGAIDHTFFRHPIFDGDTYLLHVQERLLEGRGNDWQRGYYMPAPADGSVVALRRWLDSHGAPTPTCETGTRLPPLLPKREVLDRYGQHTAGCAACRTALRRVELAAAAAGALAALAAVWLVARAAVGLPLLGTAAGGLGLLAAAVGTAAAAALLRLRRKFLFEDYVHADK